MIQHILFFKLKTSTTEEQKKFLTTKLDEFGKIEGVVSVRYGDNVTDRAPHNYSAVILLKDKDALQNYLKHEEPLEGTIKDFCEELICLDFEC